VWSDAANGLHFVLFSRDRPPGYDGRIEEHLGFAVDLSKSKVVACGILRTATSVDGWMIDNVGLDSSAGWSGVRAGRRPSPPGGQLVP
jgi:hypothetical protein